MNYAEIKKDIKQNEPSTLYLFYGPERFLLNWCFDMLKERVISDPTLADFNYFLFTDRNFSFDALSDAVDSYPVMADRKMIVIKDTGIFSGKSDDDGKAKYIDLLKNIPDYATVLIIEDSVDKRSKIYKEISKLGKIAEFEYLQRPDLRAWVLRKLSSSKKRMSNALVDRLLDLCGPELTRIKIEVEKLIAYTGARTDIKEDDILALIPVPLSDRVFDIADAVIRNDANTAFSILEDLKRCGESAIKILSIIAGTFEQAFRAILLTRENFSFPQMVDMMNLPPNRKFIAEKLLRRAKSMSDTRMRSAIRLCAKTDSDIKNGLTDEWTGLYLVILKSLEE